MNGPLPHLTLPTSARPCKKHRYPHKKDAETAINHRIRGHQRHRPEYIRLYPCPRCGGWHLTSKELNPQ